VNGARDRVLLASGSRTSTTVKLRTGRRYAFTVAALDDAGNVSAASSLTFSG